MCARVDNLGEQHRVTMRRRAGQVERGLFLTRDFLKQSLLRPFSDQITIWYEFFYFQLAPNPVPALSPAGYLCLLEGTLGKVQEKGGGIVGASCWPAHWPIVAFIFLHYHITIILATSFFHPGPNAVFIELCKLRQYTVLSVLFCPCSLGHFLKFIRILCLLPRDQPNLQARNHTFLSQHLKPPVEPGSSSTL